MTRDHTRRPNTLKSILILLVLCVTSPLSVAEEPYQGPMLTISYSEANIREVIEYLAFITEREIKVHPDVDGTISLEMGTPATPEEFYEIIISILPMYGYEAVQGIDAVHIVPLGGRPYGE